MAAPTGWTHEEAKQHDIVERLFERCATYGGKPCTLKPAIQKADWCERCIAATFILNIRRALSGDR